MTTIHLVSHTHWDREWYRTFQAFRLKLVHLIDGVLDLLDNDREFKYFMLDGQTIVLDDYLAMRPENEARLRRYVRSGRLVIGPWHILPDEFLVSPEATIRNLLEGKRTCRRFGPRMKIGYIPDPFGHIAQMPQILQGFGIRTACVQRGLSDEQCEFWWQAPDGSRVFMAYLRDGYGNAAGLPTSEPEHFAREVARLRDSLLLHSNSRRHVLLMHGTDHMEPPADTSSAIRAANRQLEGDELVHSTLKGYMASIQAALRGTHLPTVEGELRDCRRSHLLPGVLSTRMWIKQRDRQCTNLLEKWAEPFSTFAAHLPQAVPAEKSLQRPAIILRQAWRLLMECHPHDSICGCSIDQVHDEMKIRFDQVEQIGEELTRQNLETLAANVGVKAPAAGEEGSASALVVFNPHAFPRTDRVEADIECRSAFDLLDPDGHTVPYQVRGLGATELIHALLTPKELQSLYIAVHDGRVMGLSILDVKITRQGGTVNLDASVSEHQAPDPVAWQQGVEQIEGLLEDPEVTSFRVRAVSLDAARITFVANQVPGLGWKAYTIKPRPQDPAGPVQMPPMARFFLPLARSPLVQKLVSRQRPKRTLHRLENSLLKVEMEKDGSLTLTEKASGRVFRGLNRFQDGGDCGDEYNYCPPPEDKLLAPRLTRVESSHGEVQQVMTLYLELSTPSALSPDRRKRGREHTPTRITTEITLTQGIPRLDIHTVIENNARDHRLRVHFPAPFQVERALHDGHFELVDRRIGIPEADASWVEQPRPEVPQRAFTSLNAGGARLTLANRGLPEVEVLEQDSGNSEIALTLLRCVGWLSRDDFSNRKGHAGPFVETPGAQMPGTWAFDYSISVEAEAMHAFQSAYAFETPLRAMSTGIHAGILPPEGSFVQMTPPDFMVSAVKEKEDGKGWLVRGYNLSAGMIQVEMHPGFPVARAELLNLAEEKAGKLPPSNEGRLVFKVKGHGIVTIGFQDTRNG